MGNAQCIIKKIRKNWVISGQFQVKINILQVAVIFMYCLMHIKHGLVIVIGIGKNKIVLAHQGKHHGKYNPQIKSR